QTAGKMQQSALIAAHPELAVGNLAERIKPVGETSKSEQAGAGLDRLSQALLQQFLERNAAYRKRFGFPYILAIKGMGPAQILADFDRRIMNDHKAEFQKALEQIGQIMRFRLEEKVRP
ncbi:MAG: 2-oxo-4-hydroxy-4-carboxy-5-ureidoimidazoline decarboxylase, partial [Pseudomonadota bacterium]